MSTYCPSLSSEISRSIVALEESGTNTKIISRSPGGRFASATQTKPPLLNGLNSCASISPNRGPNGIYVF